MAGVRLQCTVKRRPNLVDHARGAHGLDDAVVAKYRLFARKSSDLITQTLRLNYMWKSRDTFSRNAEEEEPSVRQSLYCKDAWSNGGISRVSDFSPWRKVLSRACRSDTVTLPTLAQVPARGVCRIPPDCATTPEALQNSPQQSL